MRNWQQKLPTGPGILKKIQMPRVCLGVCLGGMLAAGIDSHISFLIRKTQRKVSTTVNLLIQLDYDQTTIV